MSEFLPVCGKLSRKRRVGYSFLLNTFPNPVATTRVVSDLHIGSPWLKDPLRQQHLLEFFESMAAAPDSKLRTLVLLGDIVEFWMTPLEVRPLPPFQNSQNWFGFGIDRFLSAVRRLASRGVNVVFAIRGNHDLELTAALVSQNYSANVTFRGDGFSERGVRFEHGHLYDLFNVPEPLSTTVQRKPFGYYVSRAVTSSGYDTQSGTTRIISSVLGSDLFTSALVELFSASHTLFEEILKRILNEVFGSGYDSWKDKVVVEDDNSTRKMSDVVVDYGGMVDRFDDTFTNEQLTEMLQSSYTADYRYWIVRKTEDVFVLGHTHQALLRGYRRSDSAGGGRIVHANSGGWIDDVEPTYVDIEYASLAAIKPAAVFLKNYVTSKASAVYL